MDINPNLSNLLTVNFHDARRAAESGNMKLANAHMCFLLGMYSTLVTSPADASAAFNILNDLNEGMLPLAFLSLADELEHRLYDVLESK